MVLVSLSAADRDIVLAGANGGDLERFDPTRPATSHLAFGYGIHRCVGAELARMELRIAFPALARRFPTMRLAVDVGELRFRNSSIVYSAEAMPVIW
jgi:cytochrome P450